MFATEQDYFEAIGLQKAAKILSEREQAQYQAKVIEAHADREEVARTKYDDYEIVAYNPVLRITTEMAEVIKESDVGPEIAYHLGSNPKEAERISKLSPYQQAKEIGRIEAKLESDPPVKKTSSAPAPIRPVTAKAAGAPVLDTTDPRSIDAMDTSTWIEADRARQRKVWEARNR
tara:strand:- start:53 stop:577 length:525 start_codon:yes stop_codon:yes gene_type:complete